MKTCTKCKEVKPLTEFYKKGKESQCKTCMKKRQHEYAYPNKDAGHGNKSSERRKAAQARYREKNREKIRALQRRYVKENLPKVLARTRKYQLAKKKATPEWLTKEQLRQIEAFYVEAEMMRKTTGLKYEVDHIVPISGKEVKGLHVPWNLQIINRTDNRKKFNKY